MDLSKERMLDAARPKRSQQWLVKEIEEKIKNTMAKLQAASSGRVSVLRLRRQKRQEIQQNAELEAQRIEEENSTVLKVTEFVHSK